MEVVEDNNEIKHSAHFQKYLIFVCWIVYMIAQIGRYSYSSNITLIMEEYGVNYAAAGLPATFYFFAYGIGQIVTGIFCAKYNKKIVISTVLVVSAICNTLLFTRIDFVYIKYIWAINGFAQANLWPILILTIGQNIQTKYKAAAAICMSTATTGGTFLSYMLGGAFAIDKSLFYYTFLVSGIALIAAAAIWFFSVGKIGDNGIAQDATNEKNKSVDKTIKDKSWKTILLFALFAEFAITSLAISGGLRQWVPSIMKDMYGLEDWMAIFVTVFLPLISIPNAFLSGLLYKIWGNFVLTIGLMFALAILLFITLILIINTSWLLVLIFFILLSMSMGIIQNQLTVQVPLYMQDKANAGFLAGFLNGCSYIGNAFSIYGLGVIADNGGWMGVFFLLLGVTVVSATLAFLYFGIKYLGKTSRKKYQ